MKLQSHYRDHQHLRKSFTQLAYETFGIQIEDWYNHGYWEEHYIPYSFVQGNEVIANVSVNLVDVVIEGVDKKAVQLGTVMTKPAFRHQGLSKVLLETIWQEYKDEVDFFYLFANRTVTDFYPKFGFNRVDEHLFTKQRQPSLNHNTAHPLRQLSVTNPTDLQLIERLVLNRRPLSPHFSSLLPNMTMFYCLNVFPERIYYLEQSSALIIYGEEGDTLHLYDVIGCDEHIHTLIPSNAKQLVLHFTPKHTEGFTTTKIDTLDDVLFVRECHEQKLVLPALFKHSLTSQA